MGRPEGMQDAPITGVPMRSHYEDPRQLRISVRASLDIAVGEYIGPAKIATEVALARILCDDPERAASEGKDEHTSNTATSTCRVESQVLNRDSSAGSDVLLTATVARMVWRRAAVASVQITPESFSEAIVRGLGAALAATAPHVTAIDDVAVRYSDEGSGPKTASDNRAFSMALGVSISVGHALALLFALKGHWGSFRRRVESFQDKQNAQDAEEGCELIDKPGSSSGSDDEGTSSTESRGPRRSKVMKV